MEENGRQREGGTRERSSRQPGARTQYEHDMLRHRRRVALIAVPGLVGVLATLAWVFPRPEIGFWFDVFWSYLPIVALSSFVLCGFGAVMMYLQTGFRVPRRLSDDADPPTAMTETDEFDQFRRDVVGRIEVLETGERAVWPSGEVDDELVQRVRERIDGKATEQYLEEIRLAVRAEESQGRLGEARGRLETTIERLSEERDALTRRGNFNLGVGSFVAVGGMAMLGYFIVATTSLDQPDANGWEFVKRFLPQLSLVTMVEVFAYFFLRLYSRSLTEIKYFQNEISNVEARLASLGTALETGEADLVGDIVRELARTERNHILKKGEATVTADQRRNDEAAGFALAKVLSSTLRPDRSKDG